MNECMNVWCKVRYHCSIDLTRQQACKVSWLRDYNLLTLEMTYEAPTCYSVKSTGASLTAVVDWLSTCKY